MFQLSGNHYIGFWMEQVEANGRRKGRNLQKFVNGATTLVSAFHLLGVPCYMHDIVPVRALSHTWRCQSSGCTR